MSKQFKSIRRLPLAAVFAFLPLTAQPQNIVPPFDWDSTFASPGTTLSIRVVEILSGPPNGAVRIAIESAGFAGADADPVLWQKMGGAYYQHRPEITSDGGVLIVPGTTGNLLGNYVRGQALDIALVDPASGNRAHARLTPFPLRAAAADGCSADAEILAGSGLVWAIRLAGFAAGETIDFESVVKKERLSDTVKASVDGSVTFPVLYPPKSKGRARVTAAGQAGCSVTLEFAIGRDALTAK